MKKIQDIIDKTTTTGLSGLMFAVVSIILAYNVFARFLGGGIKWYMEGCQYLNVWAMLIAGVGICAKGQHLRISALESALKGTFKTILESINALLTIAFYLLLAYGFFLLATKSKQNISTMGNLKMAYVYWPVPFIAIASAVSVGIDWFVNLKEKKNGKGGGEK